MVINLHYLGTTIDVFEAAYRHDHKREHGLLLDVMGHKVVERDGDIDEVEFSPRELERGCMGFLDHNHPHGLPPSGADLALAARYGLTLRAFGTIPETDNDVNYIVRMPAPDEALAKAIEQTFDAEVAKYPGLVEREARHRALIILADRLGFSYIRTPQADPVREMTVTRESHRLDVIANAETIMERGVLIPLHAAIIRFLTQNANGQGLVPIERLDTVRQLIGGAVVQAIVGKPTQNGLLLPYFTQRGKVIPNSAYFAALWSLMKNAAGAAVQWHAELMRKYLPADLQRSFELASINPFELSVREMDEDELFPAYDPLHVWLGPDGKRLSDRIWNVAGEMRRKLDAYLTDAIASSKPVQIMAAELEDYLLPSHAEKVMDTPWGSLNFDAMRLAWTETAAAHARADSAAAQLNPFVETYNFFTAPEHKCCDECDTVEAGSPYPKSDTVHLPPRHPFCICGISWNEVSDTQAVIIRLRQKIEKAAGQARAALNDFIGPLSRKFIDLLFGER